MNKPDKTKSDFQGPTKVRPSRTYFTGEQNYYLMTLYRYYGLPSEKYKNKPKLLHKLTVQFNRLTGLKETPERILSYMIYKRKNGDWPLLGRKPKPQPHLLKKLPFPVPEFAKKIPPMRILKNSNSKLLEDLKPKFKTSCRMY